MEQQAPQITQNGLQCKKKVQVRDVFGNYIFQSPTIDISIRRTRGCATELRVREKSHFPGRFTKITEYAEKEQSPFKNNSGLEVFNH